MVFKSLPSVIELLTDLNKFVDLKYKKKGKNVLVVAADTYRPGAIDQLNILAKSINVSIYKEANSNPLRICRNVIEYVKDKTIELILIDTAGRSHLNHDMMSEIKSISDLTKPDEILFVAGRTHDGGKKGRMYVKNLTSGKEKRCSINNNQHFGKLLNRNAAMSMTISNNGDYIYLAAGQHLLVTL